MSKNLYYSLKRIQEKNARYNVIFGERSNGKTYAVLDYCLQKFFETGEKFAYIRRGVREFVGKTSARNVFDSLTKNGDGENEIDKLSKGRYQAVELWAGQYFFQATGEDGLLHRTDVTCGYAFTLMEADKYKSASFPDVTTIFFDEFITRDMYLTDEFVLFQNLISTIVRQRDNIVIYMCANTVNKFGCPYFNEMGLYNVRKMKQGDIDIYNYGESGLVVAVEYTENEYKKAGKKKKSDVYFAFNNPRLEMITTGAWEMAMYPHLPFKYVNSEVIYRFFVQFDEAVLQGDVVSTHGTLFIFMHRKTTPLKEEDTDLIYTKTYDARPNVKRNMMKPTLPLEKRLVELVKDSRIFYQDNEIGEVMRSYFQWCKEN